MKQKLLKNHLRNHETPCYVRLLVLLGSPQKSAQKYEGKRTKKKKKKKPGKEIW
jgi:hypothetical protein